MAEQFGHDCRAGGSRTGNDLPRGTSDEAATELILSEHHHPHGNVESPDQRRRLLVALALTWGFALVEALAGWRGGSLALLADAGHMVTDGAALGLALLAAWIAARPPSARHSYGFGRAELFAALINALAMLAVVVGIGMEAWARFNAPRAIDGALVSAVAALGLGINLGVAWMLSHGQENLNVRGAFLHVWSLSGERLALTARVRIMNLADWPGILAGLQQQATMHGIGHATFQPEATPWVPLTRHV